MDFTLILETIVVFAAILGVLVVAHEWGHFTAARLVGMKVHEFAFGFGPVLKRLGTKNDTEYNIRMIPLGGFVRIAGMEPSEGDDVKDGFNSKPIIARALVIVSGPMMSLILGYLVFLMIGFVWGFPTGDITTRVGQVQQKSIAESAGLRTGDLITSIDGKPVHKGEEVVNIIHSSAGKHLVLTIERGGKELTIKATPKLTVNEAWKEAKPAEREKFKIQKDVGLLGFMPLPATERTGFVRSIKLGTEQSLGIVVGIVKTLFSRQITKSVGGIVMIGYQTGEMVKLGWQWVFGELAALSVMLGILNLIPWPVLDGGHVLYLVLEKIRGKRLAPEAWMTIQTIGMAAIIFLAVFLVYFDIMRIFTHTVPQ